jgi:hypothetical protein
MLNLWASPKGLSKPAKEKKREIETCTIRYFPRPRFGESQRDEGK